jgi:carboxylesterase type B
MGQSTGGSDVLCLMASPLARGLFHAAYPQSAFAIQTYDNDSSARAVGTEFYKQIGCTGGVNFNATDCMLTQPTIGFLGCVERMGGKGWLFFFLISNSTRRSTPHSVQLGTFYTGIYKGPGANTDDHRVFGPVVQPDTNILPMQPYEAFARGEIADVPLFYWLVAAEGNRELFPRYDPMNETVYRATIAQRWGPQYVDMLVALYPFPDDKVRLCCVKLGPMEVKISLSSNTTHTPPNKRCTRPRLTIAIL